MKYSLPDLPIYKTESYEGYDVTQLAKWLKDRRLLAAWNKWFAGSTGGVVDGHFIVYTHDVEIFLVGRGTICPSP